MFFFFKRSRQHSSLGTSFAGAVKIFRNLKISEPEYDYYKSAINSPIEIEDFDQKEKYVEEQMNYVEKYEILCVIVYF